MRSRYCTVLSGSCVATTLSRVGKPTSRLAHNLHDYHMVLLTFYLLRARFMPHRNTLRRCYRVAAIEVVTPSFIVMVSDG